jgi:glyoxylase-like metal-dependent hydrolase (beta-lactamase superfamily II)
VAASPLINTWYEGLGGSIQRRIDTFLAQYVATYNGRKRESLKFDKKLDFDFALEDGRPLPFFDDWVAVDTPGHTNHDIVLYNGAARLLYAADLIVKVSRQFVLPVPVIGIGQLRATFNKIRSLEVKTLALAHLGLHEIDDFQSVISSLEAQLNSKKFDKLRVRLATKLESFSPALRRMKKQDVQKQ